MARTEPLELEHGWYRCMPGAPVWCMVDEDVNRFMADYAILKNLCGGDR